ncbi:MAG: efflux transporter outer membrane subunit [Phycisphaerales bacterium]
MTSQRVARPSRVGRGTSAFPLAAAAGLWIGGCAVGPDYQRPEPAAPMRGEFSSKAESVERSSTVGAALPDPAWWGVLNDPTLTSLIGDAIVANYDLRIAESRVRQARAARGIAESAGLPQVGSGASYQRSRDSENVPQGSFGNNSSSGRDTYFAGLDASWELDFFGGIRRSVEAATADVQAAEETRRDVLVTLTAEVASNYVELRGVQRRIAVTQDNINVQTETLELVRSRFNAGLVSELDVAQATAQLATTSAVLPRLEIRLKESMHRIGVLCGKQPGELVEALAVTAPIPEAPAEVPVGLPSDLLRRRPDIRRAERAVAAATARIGEATADLYPRFSLTGAFGLRSDQVGNFFEGDSRFWSIGPALRWPIFQGGRIRSNIRLQEALTDEQISAYQRAVLGALEDVENALVGFNREQATRRFLSDAAEANNRAVELSNQLYRAGLTDFQRVLDSQRSLVVAEEALAASDAAVVQALIRLYKALGGGWEVGEPTTEQAATDQSTRP